MSSRSSEPTTGRSSIPQTTGWGIALAVGAALISGLAIFLNAFAVKQLPDAAVYTTLKNAVAAAVLLGAVVTVGAGRDLRSIERRHWAALMAVGVIGGSVPFILFFTGLAQASAPSAAFIQKTLFLWVALLAAPLLGERLGLAPILALGVLFVGQLLVLPPTGIVWGTGETLILVATLFWAVETVVVKRLLGSIPSLSMAALRMTVGLVILVGYVAATGKLSVVAGLSSLQLGWVLITGVVLAGYVGTWFAALSRAPASAVTSVLVVGAVITGALTAVSKGASPSPSVVGGYVLIVVATVVIALAARRGGQVLERGASLPVATEVVAN
jgi:drug/metabolite transporter (DMT)-like permease